MDKDFIWEASYGRRKHLGRVFKDLLEKQVAKALQRLGLYANNNPYNLEFFAAVSYDKPEKKGYVMSLFGKEKTVFISHSSKDKPDVERLLPFINGMNLPVWFDGAGYAVHDAWKTGKDGAWYYLTETGAMAKNQWIIWENELYRVLEDGALFHGEMLLKTDKKGALK